MEGEREREREREKGGGGEREDGTLQHGREPQKHQ